MINIRKNQGITLIALIVTIIVMLILAGIAFNSLQGREGIFTRSENAVQKYNNKANQADNLVDQLDELLSQYMNGGNTLTTPNVTNPSTTSYTYDATTKNVSVSVTGPSNYAVYYSLSQLTSSNYSNGTQGSLTIGPNAGEYTIYYFVKSNDANYQDNSGSFIITINKAQLTIMTGSATKEYDGTPLTNNDITVAGKVNGETLTAVATGSQKSVGSSPNTYSITWNGTAEESNYTISENLGTLTVSGPSGPLVP